MRLDWVRFDVVTINYKENNYIEIAAIWCDRKSASLVRIQIAIKVCDCNVYMVAAIVVEQLWHLFHCIRLDRDRLGWTIALPLLIHVDHLGLFYYLDEAVDMSCSKTQSSFEVSCSDVFTSHGRTGIHHCCMVELDELACGFTFINVVGKTLGYGQGS